MTNEEKFGATPEEWLRRWDAGEQVYAARMGMSEDGDNLEAVVQIITAESLRHMIDANMDKRMLTPSEDEKNDAVGSGLLQLYRKIAYASVLNFIAHSEAVKSLLVNDEMIKAGIHAGLMIYRIGPVAAFTHESLNPERLITWSKDSANQAAGNS